MLPLRLEMRFPFGGRRFVNPPLRRFPPFRVQPFPRIAERRHIHGKLIAGAVGGNPFGGRHQIRFGNSTKQSFRPRFRADIEIQNIVRMQDPQAV